MGTVKRLLCLIFGCRVETKVAQIGQLFPCSRCGRLHRLSVVGVDAWAWIEVD